METGCGWDSLEILKSIRPYSQAPTLPSGFSATQSGSSAPSRHPLAIAVIQTSASYFRLPHTLCSTLWHSPLKMADSDSCWPCASLDLPTPTRVWDKSLPVAWEFLFLCSRFHAIWNRCEWLCCKYFGDRVAFASHLQHFCGVMIAFIGGFHFLCRFRGRLKQKVDKQ